GPQPSRPAPMIVATNGWPLLADQACTDHRCDERLALAGRAPGGRPLRRRREMVLTSANHGCEGPQALQACTDDRCDERLAVAGRSGLPRSSSVTAWNGQPARCSAACSFLRLRSIIHATKMQSSYSRYIGVPIIAIETASGVGARNAAAMKIRRNAYARVRRRSATDNTPRRTRTRTITGNSNATPNPTQSWVTNEK